MALTFKTEFHVCKSISHTCLGCAEKDLKELVDFIKGRKREEDPLKHIHVAWLCIAEDSRRVEDVETKLAQKLSDYVPVIAVITKARSDNGFRSDVLRLMPSVRNAVRVRALSEVLDDGHRLLPVGLEDLVDLTNEVVPEGQKDAFVAAQKVSLDKKRTAATKVITGAATAAAAVGATPVPFSQAIALVPIEISMLAGISVAYGLPVDRAFLGTLVSSTITGVLATAGGRSLVGGLFKLIPGAGSVIGGIIEAGVASAVTATFGGAYSTALYLMLKEDPDKEITPEEVVERFKQQLKRAKDDTDEAAPTSDSYRRDVCPNGGI